MPAAVHTIKSGDLILSLRKKAVIGGGGVGGVPTVMSGTVLWGGLLSLRGVFLAGSIVELG